MYVYMRRESVCEGSGVRGATGMGGGREERKRWRGIGRERNVKKEGWEGCIGRRDEGVNVRTRTGN